MANETCNVPGCEKPRSSRGLCGMHAFRAARGKPGPKKDEALRYALPPTRGPDAKGKAGGVGRLKENIKKAQQGSLQSAGDDADDVIAAVTIFATAMGIRRVQQKRGFLFVGPDDQAVILNHDGELREASLTVGDVLRP